MAGETPDIIAMERTGTGKGAARQARRDNLVPGIVYGGGKDPLAINVPYNALIKQLKAGRFLATLFNMKVEGQDDVRVICRSVQRDVVKDLPTHVDFMRLNRNSRVSLFIPVEIEGEEDSPGLKSGGVLTMVRPEVELRCTAGDIPEKLVGSVAGLEVGDTLTISMIDLPAGTRPTIDRNFVIANIQPPSGLASQAEDDEEEVAVDEVPTTEMGPPDGEEGDSES
ncbi:50S ribosomal protein L25/general stress protein Ctc [Maribius pontilimi]|uniref:Large ribosomal subunit protein bL25 n=1 Tax=Palleronia pontilimi TaxID=1964209 RepID=A0A934I969_9RHOB|nr:50S ribosomal protein L25/general stress protein Ctc [Palleronia pontilimi]MBJ3762698.1 50S ribosomal protein L25/general stress protein Ctc [Palleronia pontilimi]